MSSMTDSIGSMSSFSGTNSVLGPGVSVAEITVALEVSDRDRSDAIMNVLERLANTARTDSRVGLQNLTSQGECDSEAFQNIYVLCVSQCCVLYFFQWHWSSSVASSRLLQHLPKQNISEMKTKLSESLITCPSKNVASLREKLVSMEEVIIFFVPRVLTCHAHDPI